MGFFKVKKITDLRTIKEGDVVEESDFTVTTTSEDKFIQFEYQEDNIEIKKVEIQPGIFALAFKDKQIKFVPVEPKQDPILQKFAKTENTIKIVDKFFEKLHVYQEEGIQNPRRGVLIFGPPGCHAKGTKVLMYDGSTKNIEDVAVGDKLMGPDSKERDVLALCRGKERMVKVKPTKGEEFIINESHILHLTPSAQWSFQTPINIKFKDFINETKCLRERLKLTRTGVNFEEKKLPLDPYFLGIWLGDGNSDSAAVTTADIEIEHYVEKIAKEYDLKIMSYKQTSTSKCKTMKMTTGNGPRGDLGINKNPIINILRDLKVLNNKHIPQIYLTGSRKQRLELLAGLIDTDGTTGFSDSAVSKGKFGTGYSYATKLETLADNVVYLCRSLGYAAYKFKKTKGCYVGKKKVFEGDYYYVSISGNLEEVPVKLSRKKCKQRKQIKDVLRTGFEYEYLPEDEYYGFTLSGDHLYLTSDFMIHHNTGKTTSIKKSLEKYREDNKTTVVFWQTDMFDPIEIKNFFRFADFSKVERFILVIEDIGGVEIRERDIPSTSSLLSILDNEDSIFTVPTLFLATTNYPEIFMDNLTNRPGRFDQKIKVDYLTLDERVELLEFFVKRPLDEEEKTAIKNHTVKNISTAHIKEMLFRSKLNDISVTDAIKEVIEEIKQYNVGFQNKDKVGF
jgi:hypothetical protein